MDGRALAGDPPCHGRCRAHDGRGEFQVDQRGDAEHDEDPGFSPQECTPVQREHEAQRARDYYRESAPLVDLIDAGSRASLRALIGIYSRLLDRIVASDYDVLARRVRVPTWEKLWVLMRSVAV